MWRPIAMCLAIGWMAGCGGADQQAREQRTEPQQQAGAGEAEASAPLPDGEQPYWDGSPCNGSGTAVVVGGQVWFVPSECDPHYVDKGDPADQPEPVAEQLGFEI